MNVPIWIILGFQKRDNPDSHNLKYHTFLRLPVTSYQCIIGIEKKPDVCILLNHDNLNHDYNQGNVLNKEALRSLTKDGILKPYTFDVGF